MRLQPTAADEPLRLRGAARSRAGDRAARWLVLGVPAGFDAFVEALGEPARARTLPPAGGVVDPEKLAAIAARFGIELLPDGV